MMQEKQNTQSAFELSKVVLGLWRLQDISGKETASIINYALSQGIDSIDEADIYGGYKSQIFFGRALKEDKTLRSKIKIVSKTGIVLSGSDFSKTGIGFYDTSHKHIIQSVEKTLTSIGTDYIDMLLIHRPDLLIQPNELDKTFQQLKQQGKVLHFGVSNFTPSQFSMLQQNMETKLETNQVEFSVLNFSALYDGTFDQCIQHQISPMIWSPLGGGNLFSNTDKHTGAIRDILTEIGKELGGATIDKVALAWIMKHPVKPKTVIGTLKTERIKNSVEASQLELSQEQWYRILITAQGKPMP